MPQPIIDPEKVDAWTASMREAFAGGGSIGTWLTLAIAGAAFVAVVWSAWSSSRHAPPDAMADLDHLVKAQPVIEHNNVREARHGRRTRTARR